MGNRIFYFLFLATLLVFFGFNQANGQLCDAAGNEQAKTAQAQYVLSFNNAKDKNWVTALKPILTEMQRIFPQPTKGIYLRNTITFLTDDTLLNEVHRYKGYFAIRTLVCRREGGMNKFIPFEDPESFVNFYVNDIFVSRLSDNFLGLTTGDLRLVENPNGIKSIYDFNENDEQKFIGWYFSAKKGLPFRRLSKAELGEKFREYSLKKWGDRIKEIENSLAKTEKRIAEVSANQYMSTKEKQSFIESIRKGDVQLLKDLEFAKSRREACLRKADAMMKGPDAKSDARVKMLNGEPEELEAPPGKGRFVYVENRDFFDNTLPKWQPQFIVVSHERFDRTDAQFAFNNKFEKEFDFNVVRKLVGLSPNASPQTISQLGDTPGGYTSGKIDNNKNESHSGVMFWEDFADSTSGQAPRKWTVSNNSAIVRNDTGMTGNWLRLKSEGLFFPDYAVLLLPKNFTLEFDVSWNKKISYYSPSFVVHLGAARYDNTLKRYDRAQVNVNSYTSAAMERIALWIDPYWNDFGRYGLEVFDSRGGYLYRKSEKTPIFFRDRNLVRVKLVRSEAMLTVYFNDTKILQEAVLGENIRWNFFGFGLTSAPNAEVGDEFYLSNIRLSNP